MKWQEVREKLHDKEYHNLYSSSSIIRMIKSKRMKLAGHVACMGAEDYVEDFVGKSRKKEVIRKT
jgi:hypothetical protein